MIDDQAVFGNGCSLSLTPAIQKFNDASMKVIPRVAGAEQVIAVDVDRKPFAAERWVDRVVLQHKITHAVGVDTYALTSARTNSSDVQIIEGQESPDPAADQRHAS